VALTFATSVVVVVVLVLVMLYGLAVQDLALTHFASFSIVLNLSWYEV
jgi:hypothetical protein